MVGEVQILGADGAPMKSTRPRLAGLSGGTPYDAGDHHSSHMVDWNPYLGSPDGELNPSRDTIVSRTRDMVRNDGWASGAITRILDNAIGPNYRPVSKPDYRALASHTGIKGYDAVWADEFGKEVEACYRVWANDVGCYCDSTRNNSMAQLQYLALRHKIIDGDALAIMRWMPERVGKGRAHYATAIQLVDPDRLSNPNHLYDNQDIRGGVEIDDNGAAIAYHIRQAHQGDWFNAAKSMEWARVERETAWGRPIVVHDYDLERADMHRGGAGILSPILKKLKMLAKYDDTELDSAIINAMFAAYIQSPHDPAMIEGLLGNDDNMGTYQNTRSDYHEDKRLTMGGARITHLFPGEDLKTVASSRPNANFATFEKAVLRNGAAALGISPQQLSQDWSDVNYSSARASMLEAWKTMNRRRDGFAKGFSTPIYASFLEECMDKNELPLPPGATSFAEMRSSYAACKWLGPARGWVDPVAEKKGSVLGMANGLATLEDECAEQGKDYRDILDQQKIEQQARDERGLPQPEHLQDNPYDLRTPQQQPKQGTD